MQFANDAVLQYATAQEEAYCHCQLAARLAVNEDFKCGPFGKVL